ncbi:cation-translocating P-type ATPase [Sphingomonas sp. 3-13AW]|uniref:cation-translocating P-type ATPase n=1 Tax=Sphingomonas sp. 3-13AW TaxID=3050450 RepID=UPI003BB70687
MTSVPAPQAADTVPWFALSAAECVARLGASERGLTEEKVTGLRAQWGSNQLPRHKRASWAEIILRQFQSPLIYLLVGAAGVSLWMGERTDALFIVIVLLLNALIGAVQEGRAGASAEALQDMVKRMARVERDGQVRELDAAELVPGDLVLLEPGAGVPADIRLIFASDVQADESLLTGEALPVAKEADAALPAEAPLGDRVTIAHAGTTLLSGRARGVVVATGERTELGKIGASLRQTPPAPPPLILYLKRLSQQIAIAMAVLILALAIVLLFRGTAPDQILLVAVALAVSAIPEGLPVAVTVGLAVATKRMAARNVIVRSLPAVEGLGACTIIATDKTGTLTVNRLSVGAVLTPCGERLDASAWQSAQGTVRKLAEAATACNEANWTPAGEPVGDSVDVALLRFADDIGGIDEPTRLGLFAYEPVNRFSSVAIPSPGPSPGGVEVVAKGAVETILAMCPQPDPALARAAEALAADGYRVLAFAHKRVADLDGGELAHPTGLECLGCVGLLDPLRPETRGAVDACRGAGIQVRMITGDHAATALTIGRQLGLAQHREDVLTGSELAKLAGRAEERARAIGRATVFARTDPAQKLLIVETLRKMGHIVAVTGDGVNDGPALHAANIGVAMGAGGTDVARGAADLILVDDNFASIVAGVEEGRITFGNLRKIAIFLVATGMAEIGMFLAATAVGLPPPLTAVQLLWGNLITETPQAVTLALGRGTGDELHTPPRAPDGRLIDGSALILMLIPTVAMALFAVALLSWELARGNDLVEARNSVLLALVLFENMFVLAIVNDHRPAWREPLWNNRWLLVGVASALGLQLGAMAWPPLQDLLGIGFPDLASCLVCLGGAGITLIATEAAKLVVRGWSGSGRHRAEPTPRLSDST